jgi:hypothetical protein
MLTRQFRFLDPARIEPDLARRLRALARDCERLALGRPVSPILLAKAPLLEDWVPTVTALGVQLVGRVTAIPFRAIAKSPPPPSGLPTLTAPWARTLSRYYRLGRPLHRDALRATRN